MNNTQYDEEQKTDLAFDKLFINNRHFSKLQSYLNKFNPIKVMKMERMEIRHSSILGWLLDPTENHGLGDEFLKSFLCEALRAKNTELALQLSYTSLTDVSVKIEWNNIDIFIECPTQRQLFIIENKIDSTQSHGQLKKYYDYIHTRYGKDYTTHGIFLTLSDEAPESEQYLKLKHSHIIDLIDNVLSQHTDTLSTGIINFINYYREILSEVCGMSDEHNKQKDLAKKLFREHRKVLEFIYEHGKANEFEYAMGREKDNSDIIKINNVELKVFKITSDTMSFMPMSLIAILDEKDKENWEGCENWWAGYPVIFWLSFKESKDELWKIVLYASVGRLTKYPVRLKLIESIENNFPKANFSKDAKKEVTKYSKFISGNVQKKFSRTDIDSQDAEVIVQKANEVLTNFIDVAYEPIEKALKEFVGRL